MGKIIATSITIISIVIVAGLFPAVAVGVTAITIVALFLLFGKGF